MKKLTSILTVLLLVALLVPAVACAETVTLAYTDGSLFVRKGPGKDYSTNGTVHDGDYIDVLRYGSVWSKVETEDGRIGYIKNLYIDGAGDDYASGTDYYDSEDWFTVYTTGSVRFRAGASTETASMGTFSKGTKLTVLGENGRFYLVKDANGSQGYVSSLYVSTRYVAPTTSGSSYDTGYITGNTVNVRKGGGMSYAVVGKVYGGNRVTVLYEGNYWTKIETSSGLVGWVNNAYIDV
ncbi:MAG: SH3 domain-containing protein [Clostridia bacterium]|nr:SH3 domain-containing protein [Clostridia bacterium]